MERARKLLDGRGALLLLLVLSVVLLGLGMAIRYAALPALDVRLTRDAQRLDSPAWTALMKGFTFVGAPWAVPVWTVIAAGGFWRRGLPRAAWVVLGSLLSIPAFWAMKLVWARARPDATLFHVAVPTAGSSFPSGHAADSTAFFGALAVLAWIHLARRSWRLPAVLGFALIPFGVDLSRVVLGAHWTSDVLGGSALGMLILGGLLRWYVGGEGLTEGGADSPTPEP